MFLSDCVLTNFCNEWLLIVDNDVNVNFNVNLGDNVNVNVNLGVNVNVNVNLGVNVNVNLMLMLIYGKWLF